MPIFGYDLSHHQPAGLPARLAAAGAQFIILKAGEGGTYTDPAFAQNYADANAAGLLTAAYWYQKASGTPAEHVARIRSVVPRNCPVIPDVEANSGGVGLIRDIIGLLRGIGYTVPLVYLPRWYWQQIGSPSLAGLPPLWSSRYPDTTVRGTADAYARVPSSYWQGYGGLDVRLLQFTSSASAGGYSLLDANAFAGTRDELAALFGGGQSGAGPAPAGRTPIAVLEN